MKHFTNLIVTIILFMVIYSCSENKSNNEFTKTFEGRIGDDYSIIAKIKFSNNQLEGIYSHNKTDSSIKINGTIDESGNIILNEFDSSGNQTGVFKGKYSQTGIIGNWSKPNESQIKSFAMIESNVNYDSIIKNINKKIQENPKIEFPPSDFSGRWSDEGDVSANSRLEMEIRQIDDKIEGTIIFSKWDFNGDLKESSGYYALTGSILENTALIKLHSQTGTTYEGKLIRKDDFLKFIQNQNSDPFFPKEYLVWKQNN